MEVCSHKQVPEVWWSSECHQRWFGNCLLESVTGMEDCLLAIPLSLVRQGWYCMYPVLSIGPPRMDWMPLFVVGLKQIIGYLVYTCIFIRYPTIVISRTV